MGCACSAPDTVLGRPAAADVALPHGDEPRFNPLAPLSIAPAPPPLPRRPHRRPLRRLLSMDSDPTASDPSVSGRSLHSDPSQADGPMRPAHAPAPPPQPRSPPRNQSHSQSSLHSPGVNPNTEAVSLLGMPETTAQPLPALSSLIVDTTPRTPELKASKSPKKGSPFAAVLPADWRSAGAMERFAGRLRSAQHEAVRRREKVAQLEMTRSGAIPRPRPRRSSISVSGASSVWSSPGTPLA